jgi:hypothetical protein
MASLISRAMITVIDTVHRRGHAGGLYSTSKLFPAVADSSTAEILLKLNSNLDWHIGFQVYVEGAATFEIFESPTITLDGAAVSLTNKNRSSSNVADGTAFSGPTISATGTSLETDYIPGGQGPHRSGGSGGSGPRQQEWIFKKGLNYLLRVTNTSGSASDISIAAGFYEL